MLDARVMLRTHSVRIVARGWGGGGVGGSLGTFLLAKFSHNVRKLMLSILIYRGKLNQKKRKQVLNKFLNLADTC